MRNIFAFFFLFLAVDINAQDIYGNLFRNISIGSGFGITHFQGDISEDDNFQPSFTINLDKKIDNRSDFQLEFMIGRLSGRQYFTTICDNPNHISDGGFQLEHQREGQKFRAEFIEFDLNYLIKLSPLFDDITNNLNFLSKQNISQKKGKLDILAKFGCGINLFRSVRRELQDDIFINSYGYQWLWEDNYDLAGEKKQSWDKHVGVRTFLIGFIVKYHISPRYDFIMSMTNRYGEHDKWDAKINQKSDVFSFYSIGISYYFDEFQQ